MLYYLYRTYNLDRYALPERRQPPNAAMPFSFFCWAMMTMILTVWLTYSTPLWVPSLPETPYQGSIPVGNMRGVKAFSTKNTDHTWSPQHNTDHAWSQHNNDHTCDETCTTHDVIAVTSAGQNDRRSYRSAVHRGRIHTPGDDETIVACTRAKVVCSVGPSSAEEEPGDARRERGDDDGAGKDCEELRG